MPFAILTLWAFADFTIFVFASAFAMFFFLSCMLMRTYCALSPCELMLILMLSVNVGGGSFYLTSAFSGFRLWLIMANKQINKSRNRNRKNKIIIHKQLHFTTS